MKTLKNLTVFFVLTVGGSGYAADDITLFGKEPVPALKECVKSGLAKALEARASEVKNEMCVAALAQAQGAYACQLPPFSDGKAYRAFMNSQTRHAAQRKGAQRRQVLSGIG